MTALGNTIAKFVGFLWVGEAPSRAARFRNVSDGATELAAGYQMFSELQDFVLFCPAVEHRNDIS